MASITKKTYAQLIKQDRESIWHPFTQSYYAQSLIPIVKGQGVYLFSADGKKYLDAISSWWVNLHGHAHPYIIEKIRTQAESLEHVIFAGFTHPPAIELATRLLKLLPKNMRKVFYTDNGSTAIEVALKMALQFWHNLNFSDKKNKIISLRGGYHGDTFGAMAAAGKNTFNQSFWNYLFEVEQIDPPWVGNEQKSIKKFRKIAATGNVACFIFEPLILGVGGMQSYSAEGLDELIKICKQHQIITIADEVMTGFGRTGTLFACDQLSESPDIICLSKGLTGGFLPLGVTACAEFIFQAFVDEDRQKTLLHGHSYTANPLACSSALASLDLLLQVECKKQRQMISIQHQNFCREWKNHNKLKRCESLGTILVLEYVVDGKSSYFQPLKDRLYAFFLEQSIIIRPLGNILYIIPPYCISKNELMRIYKCIVQTLETDIWN